MKLFWKKAPAIEKIPTLEDKAAELVNNLKTDLMFLNQETSDALASFRRIVDRIDYVNSEIKDKKELAKVQITELNALVNSFNSAEETNNKIKNKIVDFLG